MKLCNAIGAYISFSLDTIRQNLAKSFFMVLSKIIQNAFGYNRECATSVLVTGKESQNILICLWVIIKGSLEGT